MHHKPNKQEKNAMLDMDSQYFRFVMYISQLSSQHSLCVFIVYKFFKNTNVHLCSKGQLKAKGECIIRIIQQPES